MPPRHPWLKCWQPRPAAGVRLFTIPPAGSGPGLFADWSAALPPWIEVWSAVAPGRETRFPEPVPGRLMDHVEGIADGLRVMDAVPYALFGHSMGAIVAFELARHARDQHRPQPACL